MFVAAFILGIDASAAILIESVNTLIVPSKSFVSWIVGGVCSSCFKSNLY
jgi:hypothetical protein